MLYWLAVEKPKESSAVWELLGVANPTKAYRELRHIDLRVDAPEGRLILENKVLALPDSDQLRRYVDDLLKLDDHDYGSGTSWTLLSLAPLAFTIGEYRGVTWQYRSYNDLLPALKAALGNMDAQDHALFSRYVELVSDLIALTEEFDPAMHLDEPFQLSAEDVKALGDARLLALVRKQQMSRCAESVRAELEADGRFDVSELVLGAGISAKSKAGVAQHFIEHSYGKFKRRLGWQLEGSALRLVGILDPRESKRIAEDLRGEELLKSYPGFFSFDFDDGLLEPYSGKKDWLSYGGEFRYRYRSAPASTTWRQLIDTLVTASKRTLDELARDDSERFVPQSLGQ